jgi:hypothetical protein
MIKKPKPINAENIAQAINEIVPGEVIGKKYSPIGTIRRLFLFKKRDDQWERIVNGIRLQVHFLNATIGLENKLYGSFFSVKNVHPVIGYDHFNESIIYNHSIKLNLFPEQYLELFRSDILKFASGNRLICDECELLEAMEDFTLLESINELDFGSHPEFKNFLLKETSSGTKFYCRNSNEPITAVTRIRENCSLFDTYVPEEWCYRCDYALIDRPYRELLQTGVQSKTIMYDEFVCNLAFGYKNYTFPIWANLLNQLLEDRVIDNTTLNNNLIDERMNTELYGELQIGLWANSIKFPALLLNSIRSTIINEYEKKQKLENQLRISRLEKEKKEKEEEERKMDYNVKNSCSRDSYISKDNSHYYLNNHKLIGTTSVITNFFPKFDAEYWAGIKAPLMGKTPQQLLEEWDRKGKESSEAGTLLHHRIDDYYHHKEVQTDDKDYTLFKQFATSYNLNPYRSEWAIYDEDSGIVGVVDMLDHSNGEYILYDWKRSEKIVEGGQPITKNKFDEYGLKPIENVPNTDYWHYTLQLSFYRYILEKNYGIRVKESRLVVLHPNLNLPVVLTTPYMIDEVNKIIAVMKM